METLVYICLAFLLVFCVMAVTSRSILKSAIYLAVASATLGVIFYLMAARWAAVVEVSACSGLVTVIFISAISLSKERKDDIHKKYDDEKRMRFLPHLLIIGGIVLIAAALFIKGFRVPDSTAPAAEDFREIFWNTRQADIFGQIITILIGGIAVSVLFRDSKENGDKG